MTGRKPFQTLRDGMSAQQLANAAARADALRGEMTLAELRQARELTQESLGATLNVGQAAIAKMEKRADMYVGSLRRFIEAMGGQLDVVARFPDGTVKISNFADISERSDA
ncbi:MAG TPA: XRE family transcriptional regulator [Caulobacteraceae bacterium]|jgi:transcriptional regulator with XRE-family HTH domain